MSGHILLQAYAFHSHHKPLCALAAKIVHIRRVYITHIVPRQFYDRILAELSRQFEPDEAPLRELIRVVTYDAGEGVSDTGLVDKAFAELYTALAEGKPVPRGDGSGFMYPAVIPPAVVLIDVVGMKLLEFIRTLSGDSVKVFVWNSGAAAASYACAAPVEHGGIWGNLDEKLKEYEAQGISGDELHKIGSKLWIKDDGETINIPGVPPMYGYENKPQTDPFPMRSMGAAGFRHFYNLFNMADGIVLMSSPYIEGPVIEAFKDITSPRPVFAMAPLTPPANQVEIDNSRKHSAVFRETEKFLDEALSKYGENSVVYFSFGTIFWSAEPEKIWTFLDVLLELKIPVVFAHASPVAVIPEDFIKKLDESGLVYHSTWLPQQIILQHKATGWFVSHCGHNSVNESLAEGVPLICWPIMLDQPLSAAQLTRLNVSYGLLEVRTGSNGLRPVYHLGRAPVGTLEALREETRDVMTRAFGADGREKRKNAERIKDEISKSWDEGGYCWKEILGLLDFVLPAK